MKVIFDLNNIDNITISTNIKQERERTGNLPIQNIVAGLNAYPLYKDKDWDYFIDLEHESDELLEETLGCDMYADAFIISPDETHDRFRIILGRITEEVKSVFWNTWVKKHPNSKLLPLFKLIDTDTLLSEVEEIKYIWGGNESSD